MQKCHVKKGDEVVVLTGTERGKRGRILSVLRDRERVIVEGVKMIKKHVRKNQKNPQGAIVEREGSLHLSNVMSAAAYDARLARRKSSPSAS
jgi:large subunit ribosomal protein L24